MGSNPILKAVKIFVALLSFSEFEVIVLGFRCVNGGFLHTEYIRPFGCTRQALKLKCTTENGVGVFGELESVKEEELCEAVSERKPQKGGRCVCVCEIK